MYWWRIFAFESIIILMIMIGLGYIKLPRFLRRKTLLKGFPWGYYPDKVPQSGDPAYFADGTDFLHDVTTSFGGMEGFGDFGEFSGFGEMGEFGHNFGGGGATGE